MREEGGADATDGKESKSGISLDKCQLLQVGKCVNVSAECISHEILCCAYCKHHWVEIPHFDDPHSFEQAHKTNATPEFRLARLARDASDKGSWDGRGLQMWEKPQRQGQAITAPQIATIFPLLPEVKPAGQCVSLATWPQVNSIARS